MAREKEKRHSVLLRDEDPDVDRTSDLPVKTSKEANCWLF